MKKTITLLLAAAGVAMGANEISYTLDSETGAYALASTISSCNVTVAYSFNPTVLKDFSEDYAYPFTLNGKYALNAEKSSAEGIILTQRGEAYELKYTASQTALSGDPTPQTWKNNTIDGYENLRNTTFSLTSIQALSVVLTIEHNGSSNSGTAYGYVYVLDNSNEIHKYSGYVSSTVVNTNNITLLEYDEAITGSLKIYDGSMSLAEAEKLGLSLISQSAPEPTTATLSLLALAGLAARRRRR